MGVSSVTPHAPSTGLNTALGIYGGAHHNEKNNTQPLSLMLIANDYTNSLVIQELSNNTLNESFLKNQLRNSAADPAKHYGQGPTH